MPTLKQLTCTLERDPSRTPLKEYSTNYGDGFVETYVAVPDEAAAGFAIHVNSSGYIAPGLGMFVYIDGVYQCNRNRQGLIETDSTGNSHIYEANLRVRQKEEKIGKGQFLGRAWRFDGLNIASADKAPNVDDTILSNIGTIEVVVRRIKGSQVELALAATAGLAHGGEAAKPKEKQKAVKVKTTFIPRNLGFDGTADELDSQSFKTALDAQLLEATLDGINDTDFAYDRACYDRARRSHRSGRRDSTPPPRYDFRPSFADYMRWRATHPDAVDHSPEAVSHARGRETQRANSYYNQYRPSGREDSRDPRQPGYHLQPNDRENGRYPHQHRSSDVRRSERRRARADDGTPPSRPYTFTLLLNSNNSDTESVIVVPVPSSCGSRISNNTSEMERRPRSSEEAHEGSSLNAIDDMPVPRVRDTSQYPASYNPTNGLPSYRINQPDSSLASFSSRPDPIYNPRYTPAASHTHSQNAVVNGHGNHSKMPGGYPGQDPYDSAAGQNQNPFATRFINEQQARSQQSNQSDHGQDDRWAFAAAEVAGQDASGQGTAWTSAAAQVADQSGELGAGGGDNSNGGQNNGWDNNAGAVNDPNARNNWNRSGFGGASGSVGAGSKAGSQAGSKAGRKVGSKAGTNTGGADNDQQQGGQQGWGGSSGQQDTRANSNWGTDNNVGDNAGKWDNTNNAGDNSGNNSGSNAGNWANDNNQWVSNNDNSGGNQDTIAQSDKWGGQSNDAGSNTGAQDNTNRDTANNWSTPVDDTAQDDSNNWDPPTAPADNTVQQNDSNWNIQPDNVQQNVSNWPTQTDNTAQNVTNNWNVGGSSPHKSSNVGSKTKPASSSGGHSFAHKPIVPERPYVKGYWQNWNSTPRAPPAVPQPQPKQEPDQLTDVFAPSEVPYVVPEATARAKHVDHYVHAGKGYNYAHKTDRPVYIDSLEEPYAVFRFKYRSRKMLARILGSRGREEVAKGVKEEEMEERKRKLSLLDKEELVEKLLEKKSSVAGSSQQKAASEKKAPVVGGSHHHRRPNSNASQPPSIKDWTKDVAAAATTKAPSIKQEASSSNEQATCDKCNANLVGEWWHCEGGCEDYDLCCLCVEKKVRCNDASHTLSKWKETDLGNGITGPQPTGERLPSGGGGGSIKSNGGSNNWDSGNAGVSGAVNNTASSGWNVTDTTAPATGDGDAAAGGGWNPIPAGNVDVQGGWV